LESSEGDQRGERAPSRDEEAGKAEAQEKNAQPLGPKAPS